MVPPASGDELQASKKGVMEIADLVVVNKYDSEYEKSCRMTKHQIISGLHFSRPKVPNWTVPVELVSAHNDVNIESIWKHAMVFKDTQRDYIVQKRAKQLLHGLWAYMGDMLIKKLKHETNHIYSDLVAKTEKQLINQEITPNFAAAQILKNIFGE